MVVPVGRADDPFKKDGSSSTDRGTMYQSPGPGRAASKRILGIEACHVRDWNGGKAKGIDVVRIDSIDQIRSTKNLDQVRDCVPRDTRKAFFDHSGELFEGVLGNLDAGLGTVCFRDFTG